MTLPVRYFDELYATCADPWGFTNRWYEQRKRTLTLALLPEPRYRSAYEPGCSIGVLTRDLATRCDRLLATDAAPAAVSAARRRTADLSHVQVDVATLPADWPTGSYDLVVLSELGYYFSRDDAQTVAARSCSTAHTLVTVHWRHPVTDYPLDGDQVTALLGGTAAAVGFSRIVNHVEDDVIAEVWCRDGRSVATRAGLV